MRKLVLAVALIFSLAPGWAQEKPQGTPAQAQSGNKKADRHVALTWYGQSCYLLVSPAKTRVLIDPIPAEIGYTLPPPIQADLVTISHEHGDHNNVSLATGAFKLLRGLSDDKKDWQKHDVTVGDVRVRSVGVYHDEKKGAERGLNSVFIYEVAGLRIVHLGDLGHLLDKGQLKAIGRADVLMVPTGGFYTIGPEQAHKVIGQLKPKYFILPMHYRTDVLKIEQLAWIEEFIRIEDPVTTHVFREKSNTLRINPDQMPKEPKIVILNYK